MMADSSADELDRISASQWILLFVLAAVQIAHIVDFMILMPLAPQLQKDLQISTGSFGVLVSAYGIAAFLASLALAPWLDRLDRKTALLGLLLGFTLGTFLCALANTYALLLLGRIVAGGFGGMVGAVVLTIVGDTFPPSRRGTAMGVVMSAFSLSSIAGIPTGLFLANWSEFGWRAPFAALTLLSVLLLLLAMWRIPSLAGHIDESHSVKRMREVVSRPIHLRAFLFTFLLVFSSFTMIPFIAAFVVNNVGRTEKELPLIYLIGGSATLISMNLIGRLSDRYSRCQVYRFIGLASIVAFLALTHLPRDSSLTITLSVTTFFMMLTSGRWVPAMALITSSVEPRLRGAFLSINSAVQQLGTGVAPLLAGLLLRDNGPGTPLLGFPTVGIIAALGGLITIFLVAFLGPSKNA